MLEIAVPVAPGPARASCPTMHSAPCPTSNCSLSTGVTGSRSRSTAPGSGHIREPSFNVGLTHGVVSHSRPPPSRSGWIYDPDHSFVVSTYWFLTERNRAFASVATTRSRLRRSRVDLASRSRRFRISTSTGSSRLGSSTRSRVGLECCDPVRLPSGPSSRASWWCRCYGPSMAVGSSNYIEIGQSSNWLRTDRGTSLNVGVSTQGRSRCHGSGAAVGRGTCNRCDQKTRRPGLAADRDCGRSHRVSRRET